MVAACPSDNTVAIDQEKFWDGHWDAHKVGWLISGCAAAVTCVISGYTILGHLTHYNKPLEQRQVVRILLFAPIFSVVSFFSYRFFRSYTYYELVEVIWEAIAIAAFLMLLLQYIGDNVLAQVSVFARKDKKKLPLPFCCWRYRPSKAYFLFILKWSVVQYVIIRPSLSVAGIILQYYNLLCNQSLSPKYGHVYLLAIDFVSISIALYALIVLYGLVREELKGRRPLAKFATLKIAVFLTFYQSFIFSILEDHGVIKATEYWTATNVASGLNALCTSLEMVIVAALQVWAFSWQEYRVANLPGGGSGKPNSKGRTNPFMAFLHAINLFDLLVEFGHSVRFGYDRLRGKEYTRQDAARGKFDFVVFQDKHALEVGKLGGEGGRWAEMVQHTPMEEAKHRRSYDESTFVNAPGEPSALPSHKKPEGAASQTSLLPHARAPGVDPAATVIPMESQHAGSRIAAEPALMQQTGAPTLAPPRPPGSRPLSWEPQAL